MFLRTAKVYKSTKRNKQETLKHRRFFGYYSISSHASPFLVMRFGSSASSWTVDISGHLEFSWVFLRSYQAKWCNPEVNRKSYRQFVSFLHMSFTSSLNWWGLHSNIDTGPVCFWFFSPHKLLISVTTIPATCFLWPLYINNSTSFLILLLECLETCNMMTANHSIRQLEKINWFRWWLCSNR